MTNIDTDSLVMSKEHMRFFFSILDKIGIAIYLVNPENYEIIAANAIAEKFLGNDPIGKKCYQLLLKQRNSPCEECINEQICKNKKDIKTIPLEFKSNDRWYKSLSKVVDYGEQWGGLLKLEIIMDITESKLMEKEINSLTVFKEKVENLPHVPVFTFGKRGRITMINDAASQLLGYDKNSTDILHIWHIVEEETREKIYNLIEEFSNSDRQTIECKVIGRKNTFDAWLDILLHRDVKGTFLEATVFIIKK